MQQSMNFAIINESFLLNVASEGLDLKYSQVHSTRSNLDHSPVAICTNRTGIS